MKVLVKLLLSFIFFQTTFFATDPKIPEKYALDRPFMRVKKISGLQVGRMKATYYYDATLARYSLVYYLNTFKGNHRIKT